MAHDDPDIKGDCVRLKILGHNRPYYSGSEGVFPGPLRIIARIQVKTGTEADFELLANELVLHSREELGCLAYDLWRVEGESEGSYAFIEHYVDSAAADAHRRTKHFRQIGRKLGEYLAGAPEVMQLKSV